MKRRAARPAAGFTLLSVLVAMVIMGLGMLGVVRAALTTTSAATQNQIVASIATLGNGFWGAVQSNPAMLASPSFSGTFNAGNASSAPTPLQTWLSQATAALPGAQITIATGPDSASSAACTAATGCSVVLTLQWTQAGAPGLGASTRSQVFYYQFGL